jgi:hypothetical protein
MNPLVATWAYRQPRLGIEQVRPPPENMMDLIRMPPASYVPAAYAGSGQPGPYLANRVQGKKLPAQSIIGMQCPGIPRAGGTQPGFPAEGGPPSQGAAFHGRPSSISRARLGSLAIACMIAHHRNLSRAMRICTQDFHSPRFTAGPTWQIQWGQSHEDRPP